MLQPTDGGYTNGYHHAGAGGISGGHRVRRGSRGKSRGRRGGGSDSDARVFQWQLQPEDEEEREKPAPPCTDFDAAYFNSYAHVGIHEEMIKVLYLLYSNVFKHSWLHYGSSTLNRCSYYVHFCPLSV